MLKVVGGDADTVGMNISEDQVRRAVEYLRTSDAYADADEEQRAEAPQELVSRVVAALQALPDVREDRIAHARELIKDELPDSEELATKLIGRLVSDAVR